MNPYTDDLRAFTVDDLFQAIAAVNEETQRLEFKRQIPSREIAYNVCAFANADGGLIVVGIEDPVKGQPLTYAAKAPDVSHQTLLGISSAVNAWVHPAPDFEVVGLAPNATGNALIAIRVAPSNRGPLEYLGSDRKRLPIRRGNETLELSLSDIQMLQQRQDTEPQLSPIKNKIRFVSIQPTSINPDIFFGIEIAPAVYRAARLLESDDDGLFRTFEATTRGKENHIHEPLPIRKTLAEAFFMADGEEPPGARTENQVRHRMQFDADGEIIVRFGQRPSIKLVDQYCGILLTGYYLAQQVFRHFELTSRANVRFRAILGSDATKEGVSKAYEEYFHIDLARQRFADAFVGMMMHMYRTANGTSTRDAVRHELQHYADLYLPVVDTLPDLWTAAT